MAVKAIKKEVMNDEIKELGEDAEIAINELLGLYGFNDEQKRIELRMQLNKSCKKKIAHMSEKQMASKRQMMRPESENFDSDRMNDYASISSDKDSSSREDSKSPLVHNSASIDKTQDNNCSWCHQTILSQKSNEVIGTCGNVFCSENCFLLWRRASFKRSKTCDFCKNVRNAVSYVDFNDGTIQLQFCSEKCLNQYKMKIFCRETQAQLELNPHLKESNNESKESLITPADWLKNCQSRSPSLEKEQIDSLSNSPSPVVIKPVDLNERIMRSLQMNEPSQSILSSLPSSAKIISGVTNFVHSNIGSKKPLINVLPSSKLLSRNLLHCNHKSLRKRRVSTRLTQSTKINQIKPNRLLDPSFSSDHLKEKIHTQISGNNMHPVPNQSAPPFTERTPINLFKLRLPFPPLVQQRIQQPPEDGSNLNLLPPSNPFLPPPVVLVPYPIPLPIILPIPLPLTSFLKAYQTKGYSSNDNDSQEQAQVAKGTKTNENEQPLDLSSEQGVFCEAYKNFIGMVKSNNAQSSGKGEPDVEVKIMATNHDSENDIKDNQKTQHHTVVTTKDDASCENNRPLRKRKIIADEHGKTL